MTFCGAAVTLTILFLASHNKKRGKTKKLSLRTKGGVSRNCGDRKPIMMAFGSVGRESEESSEIDGGRSTPEVSSPQEPFPTGLSALIQAATSQLGHLADVAAQQTSQPTRVSLPVFNDGDNDNFPERLMALCSEPSNLNTITFLPDGKFFAVRQSSFEKNVMKQTFEGITTFNDFLALAEQWGFSRFQSEGITIFRHPKFVAGDYEQCATIRYGETPEAARVHALPERARSIVVDKKVPPTAPPKRRLSPRRASLTSASTSKQRVDDIVAATQQRQEQLVRQRSSVTSQHTDATNNTDDSARMDEDSVRSVAKAIAVDKLNMERKQGDAPLVDTAVTSATQEIVSEAIESLLRDEGHSKETFMKHEKELSRSSIPGVVPVCKQLFSSTYKDALSIIAGGGAAVAAEQALPQRTVTDDSGLAARQQQQEQGAKVLQEASNSPEQLPPSDAATKPPVIIHEATV